METKSTKDLLLKILFIVGIFVIVIVLAFALIKVVPLAFKSMSNVGNIFTFEGQNPMGIELDRNDIKSGVPFNIRWDYEPTESGVYEIEYSCFENLKMQIGTANGNKDIVCNQTYQLDPSSRSVSVLPILEKVNSVADITIRIKYVSRGGEVLIKDSVDLSVINRAEADFAGSGTIIETESIEISPSQIQTSTVDSTSSINQIPSNQTTNQTYTQPAGLADLRLYDVYTIDDVTIVFSVSNVGSRATGIWYFNYAMPDGDVQMSPNQPSLLPGQAIRYTLRLQDVPRGTVAIALDPQNFIREISLINNIVAIEIRGDGGRVDDRWYDSNRRADLEISGLEVGKMSGSRFFRDEDIYTYENAAVRFIVKNIGGESTGTWRFEMTDLPYFDADDFESQRQNSLRPGESREIIIELGRPDNGTYDIRVNLDPNNDIREESTRNNYDSKRLRVLR